MGDEPRSWTWDVKAGFDPEYTATATPDGISYIVWMSGPAGGPGMAGYQSYEELLANGGIHDMPPDIEAEIRAHAEALLAAPRARLRWQLRVGPHPLPAREQLAYVSAAIDDQPVHIAVLEQDCALLWEGSVSQTSVRLSLAVGFGRPWRQPGARVVHYAIEVTLQAGETMGVTCAIAPDFTIATQTHAR